MNTIAKLNEHFSKFGNIVNLQVSSALAFPYSWYSTFEMNVFFPWFITHMSVPTRKTNASIESCLHRLFQIKHEGDPGAALISFTTNNEASAAYHSSEPVFNNRFIKLFWHNKEKANENQNAKPQVCPLKQETESHGFKSSFLCSKTNNAKLSWRRNCSCAFQDSKDTPQEKTSVKERLGIPPVHKLSLNKLKKTAENNAKVCITCFPGNSRVSSNVIGLTVDREHNVLVVLGTCWNCGTVQGKSAGWCLFCVLSTKRLP